MILPSSFLSSLISDVHCYLSQLQVVANASKVHPKDSEAPPSGVDDMTKLAYLHEPGVLDNLRRRYDINEIYVGVANLSRPPFCMYVYVLCLHVQLDMQNPTCMLLCGYIIGHAFV